MTTPAVSVVMPVYKPDFLAAAIESVLAQTMRDFELILINDGSPHKRADEIAAAFAAKDSRVRCLRQDNKGVAAARNTGTAAARAPYIMLMDDDDISLSERMECQLRFLQSHPQVAAVGCRYLAIDNNGEISPKFKGGKPWPELSETVIQQTPPPLHCEPVMSIGPCVMIRKAAYNEVGGMRGYFRVCEDVDFHLLLEEKFAVATMPQTLYHYRFSHNPRQQTKKPDAYLYVFAAKYSAHCRRNGQPDIIGDSPSLETVLMRGVKSGFAPRREVMKAAKKLLLQKRYVFLRSFFAAAKKRGGGGLKPRLKLAYWSLANNRLGFLLSGLRSKYAFYTGMRGLMQIAIAKMTNRRQAVCFRHPLVRAPFYLRVPSSDAKVFRQVLIDGEYGDIPRLSKVTAIIDAGANTGITSCFFASRYPDAKIVALEPESGNFAMLKKNAAPYANIKAERAALWHEETTLRLSDPGLGEWGFITGEKGEGETAPALTVDGVMKKHGIERASILKVDIEGAEREVFANPAAWLERADMIVVETHDRLKPGCEATVAAALKGFSLRRNGELACYFRRDSALPPDDAAQ